VAGDHPVQVLRTYPRRRPAYPFAPLGERSVARAYAKVLGQAQHLVYLEDQYLWSPLVADVLTRSLVTNPGLHLVAVLPHHPDQQGRITGPPNLVSRKRIVHALREAAPGRVALYGLENRHGTPVYVHAKACIVDDEWAAVGSDNLNRRSWTHDSELSVAVCDADYAKGLRDELAREHLGLKASEGAPGLDELFVAFTAAAGALQRWHDEGRVGTRPPGQLRPLVTPSLRRFTQVWAGVLYRAVYDPDGRPLRMRLRGSM
jgi:phosphatidylserine/phosphatidylglycerophosphate/cardiolipin synthase-like enzyme